MSKYTLEDENSNPPSPSGTRVSIFSVNGVLFSINAAGVVVELGGTAITGAGTVSLVTGILTGGLITANAANPTTQYDIAAGVAQFADFTDPVNPLVTQVNFGPFIGVDPLNLATANLTRNSIDSSGNLVKKNTEDTSFTRRFEVIIQSVSHVGGLITSFSLGQNPAYNVQQALLDYVKLLGAINSGNEVTAASSADLKVIKSEGTQSLPFINFTVDPDAPNDQDNPVQDPASMAQIYIDSTQASGFNVSFVADVPVGFWDDGSDTLQATTQWVNYYFYFAGITLVCVIGQASFAQQSQAEAARFPGPVKLDAILDSTLRTVLTVKGNVTDLLNSGDVDFFQVSGPVSGGSSSVFSVFGRTGVISAASGDYDADQVDYDNTTSGLAAAEVQAAIDELVVLDATAIHNNVAGEIAAVALKAGPVNADFILIEDSADSNNKKRVTIGTLPTGGGGGEANTASNAGTDSLVLAKSGVDLPFRGLNGINGIVTTVNGNDIDIDGAALIESGDTAGGDLGGTYPNPTVDDGADGTAIHDNVNGEIAGITEKVTPVNADFVLIEDSAASNSKKRVQIGNLPGGGGGVTDRQGAYDGGPSVAMTAADGAMVNNATDGVAWQIQKTAANVLEMDTAGALLVTPTSGQPFSVTTAGGADIDMTAGGDLTLTAGGGGSAVLDGGASGDAFLQTGGVTKVGVTGVGAVNVTPTVNQPFSVTTTGTGDVDVTASGDVTLTAGAGNTLTLDATSTGDVALQVAGATKLALTAAGAVAVTPTSGQNFSVATTGAGQILLTSASTAQVLLVASGTGDSTFGSVGGEAKVESENLNVVINSGTTLALTAGTSASIAAAAGSDITLTSLTTGNVVINGATFDSAGELNMGTDAITNAGAITSTGFSGPVNSVTLTAAGSVTNFLNEAGAYVVPAGGGDFVGPGSSVSGNLVSFADTTGKLGADSGVLASDVSTHLASTANPHSVTLQQAYDADRDVTTSGVMHFRNITSTDTVLRLSRTFAGAGTALEIFLGLGGEAVTGRGISALTGVNSTAKVIFVDNLGSGDALDIMDAGFSNLRITGAGAILHAPTSGQPFTVTSAGGAVINLNGVTVSDAGAVNMSAGAITNAGAITSTAFNGPLTGDVNSVTLTAAGAATNFLNEAGNYVVPAGGGDFVGPGSSVSGNLVSFADTTGKLGADSGVAAADVVASGDSAAGGDISGTYPTSLTVNDGADATAIHDNVASEISAITVKGTPVGADFLLIEDSAAANVKKHILISSLPGGSGEVNTASNSGTVSLVLAKSVFDLPFRGLLGINNIGVAINANDVEIDGTLLALNATDMIAGAGLTGGGTLAATRTFNVIANADASIVVNANDVQVGVLATDAQHGVRGGGTQHADVIAGGADGFMTGADKTKLDAIEPLADVTDAANVNSAGAVMETDFNAQTILAATADDTPLPLTVPVQTLVGRITAGNVDALTATEVQTLLNVEDGADVTDQTNVLAALVAADVEDVDTITFGTPGTDTSTSNVLDIDFSDNQKRNFVLTENVTSVTYTLPPGAGNFMLRIEQASGVFSLPAAVSSWPAATEFVGDTAPVAPTANNNAILLAGYYDGSIVYWQTSGVFNN